MSAEHSFDLDRFLHASGGELGLARREAGFSQEELAELIGVHRNTIGSIERGDCDPSSLIVGAMHMRLGCMGVLIESCACVPLRDGPADAVLPAGLLEMRPSEMAAGMGLAVRERRLAMGLSLEILAGESGLHLNTVWNFERGLVSPSMSTLWRVYRALGVAEIRAPKRALVFS